MNQLTELEWPILPIMVNTKLPKNGEQLLSRIQPVSNLCNTTAAKLDVINEHSVAVQYCKASIVCFPNHVLVNECCQE